MKKFIKRLNYLHKILGTWEKVADYANVDSRCIRHYLAGTRVPSKARMLAFD
jgi:hypothetical protein